ncbi:phage tail tube protein [Novosphingobium sp. NDB2Meth1]|uniref:phage tail tube protein n=1 Tax=Novosphingobium sp. NDB2Meth1 TaxID=1892847 RepID=UPI00093180B5|nr:phage tail tube protein [Novosphingobium sp. NDB2Meth1]
MSNPNQVVGQVNLKIDGATYPTDGTSSMEIGGTMREPVEGDNDASAFKESTKPAKCEVNILYKKGVSLSALRAIDNATVILVTDTGTTWLMRNAYVSDVITWSQDGKAKVVFQGPPAEEVL